MKNIFLVTVLLFGSLAFAANDINKIIGENDLVAVKQDASNIPFRYRELVDAFGMMSMGCTATHIGNGYVLTAGHCFWAPRTMVNNTSCEGETISWGMRDAETPYLVSQCETVIAAQHSDSADFAIVKVSPIPLVAIAPDMQRRAATGDTVTIFSHPDEMPLQWSKLCGVEYARNPELPPDFLEHKCDTNPGSSGATILNVLTLKVIGIHDGGVVNDETGVGMNYGTYIMDSPLYEQLKQLGFN